MLRRLPQVFLRPLVAVLAAAGEVPAALAGEAPRSETPFFEEPPVVLSVSRMPQSLAEAPGAVTVIDREIIRASGARTIADVMRLVPGFNVGLRNGHTPAVASHLYTDDYARRMQVLIDGRSVYSPFFVGGIDWSSLPIALDDIETIEVMRGTNSVTYGSNAYLGVVNIITRTAREARGARVEVSQGDKGIRDRTARIGVGDDRLAARITWGVRRDDGLDSLYDTSRTEFANGRLDWRLGTATDLSVWAGGSAGRRGEGFERLVEPPFNPNTFYPPHTRTADTGFGHLRLRHAFSADNELSFQYYRNRESSRDRWTAQYIPGIQQEGNADRIVTRENVEIQHVVRPFAPLRLAYGFEWRRDTALSPLVLGTDQTQNAFLNRFFVNGEWRATKTVIVNAGVMRENYSLSGDTLSPRGFINWIPMREHAFRIGATRGYRTPTIFEDRANWQTNVPGVPVPLDWFYYSRGPLRAERVDSREIGYVGEWLPIRGTVDLRVFEERYHDFLCRYTAPLPAGSELVSEQAAYSFGNCAGDPRTLGYEAAVKARPFRGTLIVASYSYVSARGRYYTPPGTTLYGDPRQPGPSDATTIFPSQTSQLLVKQTLPGQIDASLAWYKVIGFRASASQLGGTFIAPEDPAAYSRVDARVAKRVNFNGRRAEVAVTGQNLGRGTDDFYRAQQFTRRYFATVAFEM